MKHFFYILTVLTFLLGGITEGFCQTSAEKQIETSVISPNFDTQTNSSSYLVNDLYESIQTRIRRARDLKPEDISLVEKPQHFDFYTLLFLMGKDAGLLTGNKGLGEKQMFEFGQARLISCLGNLNEQSVLVTGFSVILNDGWILKRPVIPVSESDLWQKEEIFYPLRLENQTNRTDSYDYMVVFPILYHLSDAKQPFHVEKEITLTACQADNCVTKTQMYTLSVDAGKGYQTDVCPSILHDLYFAPQQLTDTIQVTAHQNNDKFMQLNLTFPETVSDVDIQNESHHFSVYKKFVQGKNAHLILKSDSFPDAGERIQLNLITSLGIFKWEGVPDNEPFVLDTPVFKWSGVFWYGFYLFLFSPLYLLFWSLRSANRAQLEKVFRFVFWNIVCLMTVLGSMLYFGMNLDSFFRQPIVLGIQTVLLIFILFRPFMKSDKKLCFLMWLMPYPFFYQLNIIFPAGLAGYTFGTVFWWGLCALMPFLFTFRHPILFESFTQAEKPIRKIIRLPVFLMLCWMSINTVLSVVQTTNDFSETELTDALNNGKSVFVSVYQAPCVTCMLNQFAGKHFYPTNVLFSQNKLRLMKINQNTSEGVDFLNKYHIQKGVSFNVLFGPEQKYGQRIENYYIQPEEWEDNLIRAGVIVPEKVDLINEDVIEADDTPLDERKVNEVLEKLKKDLQEENQAN